MATEADVRIRRSKRYKTVWYITLNNRPVGAAKGKRAALKLAGSLQARIDKNPELVADVPKGRAVKTKKGAISKAAKKRIANRKKSME